MSMPFRTGGGELPPARDDADKIFDHWEPSGTAYLTDGVNLFRYVGGVPNGRSELPALEHCRSLKILLFSLDELRALGSRSVDSGAKEREKPASRQVHSGPRGHDRDGMKLHPLTTPSGRSCATRPASPARSTTATTRSTSL